MVVGNEKDPRGSELKSMYGKQLVKRQARGNEVGVGIWLELFDNEIGRGLLKMLFPSLIPPLALQDSA